MGCSLPAYHAPGTPTKTGKALQASSLGVSGSLLPSEEHTLGRSGTGGGTPQTGRAGCTGWELAGSRSRTGMSDLSAGPAEGWLRDQGRGSQESFRYKMWKPYCTVWMLCLQGHFPCAAVVVEDSDFPFPSSPLACLKSPLLFLLNK